MTPELASSISIFVLALLVGFEVISKIPTTLHTPMMSGANSIHGVVLVGAILVAGLADDPLGYVLAFLASAFAAMNVVGGYVVTDRMLGMFRGRPPSPPANEASPSANGTSPSASEASPSANEASPSANGTSPSANGASPSAIGASPSASEASPSANATSPSANGASPSAEASRASTDAPHDGPAPADAHTEASRAPEAAGGADGAKGVAGLAGAERGTSEADGSPSAVGPSRRRPKPDGEDDR